MFKLQPDGKRRWAEREDKENNSVRRSRCKREKVCRNRRVQDARRIVHEGESSPDDSSFFLNFVSKIIFFPLETQNFSVYCFVKTLTFHIATYSILEMELVV